MSELIPCPHCHVDVVPSSIGICPSCGKNVRDQAEIAKSNVRDQIWNRIVEAQTVGERFATISREMDQWPFPLTEIEVVRQDYAQHLSIFRFQALWKLAVPGAGALLLGILATVGTWMAAAQIGGVYVIAHGLMLYGVVALLTGVARWVRAH